MIKIENVFLLPLLIFQGYKNISSWRGEGHVYWQSSYKIGEFPMSEIVSYETDPIGIDTTGATFASPSRGLGKEGNRCVYEA